MTYKEILGTIQSREEEMTVEGVNNSLQIQKEWHKEAGDRLFSVAAGDDK